MNMLDDAKSEDRRSMGWIVIVAALALTAGRIAVVSSDEGDTAFLSANDRSRWCTVASLVEDGTYEIDRQISIVNPIHRHRYPWQTIDKVQHLGDDGELHFYSSKPPLFPTMVAGVYAMIRQVTGLSMTDHPAYVPRMVLAIVNLPMMFVFLWATIGVINRVCRSQWSRSVGAVAASFGTMVLPFSISLNNHLPAAAAIALVMGIYFKLSDDLRSAKQTKPKFGFCFIAGVAAAFAAANELPALSMTVFWAGLFWLLSSRTVIPFLLGILLVAVAFFGTNWIAHQSLRPPYAHRGDGSQIKLLKITEDVRNIEPSKSLILREQVRTVLNEDFALRPTDNVEIAKSDEADRWRVFSPVGHFSLIQNGDQWRLGRWDDWYEYPGSYWQDGNRRGVDRGEPSRAIYLFHATIGHHGIFSLTPFWLLFPLGMVSLWKREEHRWLSFTAASVLATVVCFTFYMLRPMIDRNYGGVSVCFRWLLWLAPIWLVLASSALDRMASNRSMRRLVVALLALSVFSVSTALSSPWQSPWLYQYWQFLGWLDN
ncbi:hypothetical protein Pla22_19580 [Rubripirellula amarantea]|uniref:Glycosyltransferase RgtA/B/C/D-like domain-containing protein n=1 Tax=Rubripirellula amarantea TaxID=2527999 RepID=A0A5C5WWS2_9BACT|nr:hypothetical protein [Rubripirellula amarantea]TWT54312.1 hypothetical protein Pla22_19580 [Rubripirellula amarantea]